MPKNARCNNVCRGQDGGPILSPRSDFFDLKMITITFARDSVLLSRRSILFLPVFPINSILRTEVKIEEDNKWKVKNGDRVYH